MYTEARTDTIQHTNQPTDEYNFKHNNTKWQKTPQKQQQQ